MGFILSVVNSTERANLIGFCRACLYQIRSKSESNLSQICTKSVANFDAKKFMSVLEVFHWMSYSSCYLRWRTYIRHNPLSS